jgi:predicted aldo/keto reductase-like oxidoreductase
MKYKPLGRTGIEVSAIGYGAIKLSGVTQEVAFATINRALDLGVNFIDTARSYGDSERKVGVATKGRRDEFYIATKSAERTAEESKAELMTSLSELGMDRIDLWQLHTVSDRELYEKVMAPGGALETAKWAKEEGLVDHIGITIHRDLGVMKDAINSGEFETIMVAYSIIDQEAVEPEVLPLAAEKGVGVIVMKPLSGGNMVTPRGEDEPKPDCDPIVRGNLRYIISHPAVSVTIPGIEAVEEVEENCEVGDDLSPLSIQEKEDLMNTIGSMGSAFRYGQTCLRCEYCQPCPNEIDIPQIFKAADQYDGYPDNLKYIGLNTYRSVEVKPDSCDECQECVEKCPAGLDVPNKLKEAQKILEEAIDQMGG